MVKRGHENFAPAGVRSKQLKSCRSTPQMTRMLIVGLLTIGAIVSASISIHYAAAQAADELSGAAELKKGDYENAIKLLSARLAAKPADAEAETGLLRAYLETGRYPETESAARKFLIKNPDAAGVRHQLAEALAMT